MQKNNSRDYSGGDLNVEEKKQEFQRLKALLNSRYGMGKCPFILRSEALYYANWEGAQKVALLIDELPDPDPNELIAAAIKLMDSEQLQKMYLKLSECLYRAIINKSEKDDTVHFGCARPGTVVEVDITVKDGDQL